MIRKMYRFEAEYVCEVWQLSDELADKYEKQFRENLRIADMELSCDAKALIRIAIDVLHDNARWYYWAIIRERSLQWLVGLLSLALLVGVPLLLAYSPDWARVGVSESAEAYENISQYSAMIAAALAGVFAAQRAVTAWATKRKVLRRFYDTKSAIVEIIYRLETEWGPKLQDDKLTDSGTQSDPKSLSPGFAKALRDAIEECRTLVREETALFYADYAVPVVEDVSGALDASATGVTKLISAFGGGLTARQKAVKAAMDARVSAAEAKATAKKEFDAANATVEVYEAHLAKVIKEIQELEQNKQTGGGKLSALDATRLEVAQTTVKTLQTELATVRKDVAKKEAALKVLN